MGSGALPRAISGRMGAIRPRIRPSPTQSKEDEAMMTNWDLDEHDDEERIGKAMVVIGAVAALLTLLVLGIGWILN